MIQNKITCEMLQKLYNYDRLKMAKDIDVILFGATGFTGKHTIPYIAKLTKSNGRSLTWGVAGRSESKLKALLEELKDKLGIIGSTTLPSVYLWANNYFQKALHWRKSQ